MPHVMGVVVRLRTESQSGSDTDDHIYIGVNGSGGGREFPLDVHRFNDFEKGQDVKYWFGTVWDGAILSGAKKPYRSEPGNRNDPGSFRIELDQVNSVYIRKQGDRTTSGDDAYQMDRVEVTLFGAISPQKRTFRALQALWFANEYGHQAWLTEV